MSSVEAIGSQDVTKIGVGVIVVLIVLAVVAVSLITAIIGRIIVLVAVIVLAIVVWQQRTHIENSVNSHACKLDATFFGVHLDPPDSVRSHCRARAAGR